MSLERRPRRSALECGSLSVQPTAVSQSLTSSEARPLGDKGDPMAAKTTAVSLSDILGLGRLAADAATGLTDLVEQMHTSILETPGPVGPVGRGLTGGVTRLVYRGVRSAFRLSGAALGFAHARLGANQQGAAT